MSAHQARQLMHQRRFLPLFILLQTGTFNDNALKNALIGLITFGGIVFMPGLPSQARVPVAAFLFTGPFLLICAVAGQMADKYDRAKILKNVKRAEILIMLLAGLGFWLMNVWILCAALFFMGAQSGFFSPTKNAVLPQWLSDEELITGNALLNGFVFVFVLTGMVAGLMAAGSQHTARVLACIMIGISLFGWLASLYQPPAPPPSPDMKIDFNPVTAIWKALAKAVDAPSVLRPMLGIAWFYGLSTVLITILPDFVSAVMGYDRQVLIRVLALSTLGILTGSLLCSVLGGRKIWGQESIGLSALGITGIVIFTLDIYLNAPSVPVLAEIKTLRPPEIFWQDMTARRFIIDIVMASICSGMFVVPMQAMAQRRAEPAIRAQLMSAGAVLLNLAVNLITIGLIVMAAKGLPARSAFLLIIVPSLFAAAYCIWRYFHPRALIEARPFETS